MEPPIIAELPTEMVQHIQTFLKYKEAAQTSLVAESWYKAWCFRPILLLSGRDFDEIGFWDYATKTVQKCIDLNVKVDKLILIIPFSYDASLVDKLVLDVSRLGVNSLKLYFNGRHGRYVLPSQVFANKKLTELYLASCKVDNGNVVCPSLRSLSLNNVSIEDNVFTDILVGSPSIENLTLYGSKSLKIDARYLCNLKNLIVEGVFVLGSSDNPSLVICGRFLNLSCMLLKDVNVDDSFFKNLSSRFPKLEDLTLRRLKCDVNIQISSVIISSNSIKRLSLEHSQFHGRMWDMGKFDVPNIRKFKFSGDHIPPLSIPAASEDCESEIDLNLHKTDETLSRIRELRRKLGRSKISLQLKNYSDSGVSSERSFEDFYLPAVEELKYSAVKSSAGYNFFIECVFSFRPKLVYFVHNFEARAITILYKEFTKQKKNSFDTTTNGISFMNLMEVTVEFLEDSLNQWQPLKSSSVVLEMWKYRAGQLRLQLKWESPTTPEQTLINFIDR